MKIIQINQLLSNLEIRQLMVFSLETNLRITEEDSHTDATIVPVNIEIEVTE